MDKADLCNGRGDHHRARHKPQVSGTALTYAAMGWARARPHDLPLDLVHTLARASHQAALLGRGEDPHRLGKPARRGQHRRVLLRHRGKMLRINEDTSHQWSKEFLEAGKKRLAGKTADEATFDGVKILRAEAASSRIATPRGGARRIPLAP